MQAVGTKRVRMKVCIVGAAIGGLVGVVCEIGAHVGIATPSSDARFGLVRLLAQTKGL
jgi:ketopantoate reductase